MCGIAAFAGNRRWVHEATPDWPGPLGRSLAGALERPAAEAALAARELDELLSELGRRFDELMCFGFAAAARDRRELRGELERLAGELERAAGRLADPEDALAGEPAAERLLEAARDQRWQIVHELLANEERTERLLPPELRGRPARGAERARLHLAWAIEQVLENIDRLEVRGRDSAGVNVLLLLAPCGALGASELERLARELEARGRGTPECLATARLVRREGERLVVSFAFRTASIVGRLGDNTERLREAVRAERLLWELAPALVRVNVLAHTRWASNGIINVPNCHPVDAVLANEERLEGEAERDLWFVLNGDVDNERALEAELRAEGHALDPRVTTDAKLLPLVYRLATPSAHAPRERFAALMARCQGSLAVVFQDPSRIDELLLALKGSGQGLYAARTPDGWIVSSEIYGLAARARAMIPLVGQERGGMLLRIRADEAPSESELEARYVEGGASAVLGTRAIEIFSRDIWRGEHPHFLAKELSEAPESIAKTLRGKYRRAVDAVHFQERGPHSFEALLARLRDPRAPRFEEVLAIGQGTASIAAMGAAWLIEQATAGSGLRVSWAKGSEVCGFGVERSLERMLLVPISQSGTTTDTNRTVDLLRARGAFVHAIVNRRDSPLVRRSHSHTYTSDGRDVEMAVASTKAFYSQIAAAKLLALLLARELGTLSERAVARELRDLEALPDKVREVLANAEPVAEAARIYAPYRSNWALVGNGPNKIAAEEVRIKISELCYKSIPCDFTEDKKHIDLSTEPLTLVMASDLPEAVVQDTAKEAAIFKAHGGRPIVVASRGETRFDAHAERVLFVPPIGSHLSFVLETVVGHLFGYHAALAIDRASVAFRELRSLLALVLEGERDAQDVLDPWDRIEESIASGALNAALPAATAAALGGLRRRIERSLAQGVVPDEQLREGIALLTLAVEETARPIDSIRHQAKTVTVGLSRPEEELAPALLAAFERHALGASGLRARDARELRAVSPLLRGVEGALVYEVLWEDLHEGVPALRVESRSGSCAGRASRYDRAHPAAGMKRKSLRLGHAVWSDGKGGAESLLLLPFFAGEGARCERLLLLHLDFVERAPAPQKRGVLERLGARYDELLEALEERDRARELDRLVERLSPRDLVLRAIPEIVAAD